MLFEPWMVRRLSRVAIALVGTAWISFGLDAAEPGEVRVARLIRQLGSARYTERTRAASQLEQLGPAGERQLVEALSAEDAEIRLRARDLLRRLEIERLFADAALKPMEGEVALADLVPGIAAQTGSRIALDPDCPRLGDRRICLDPGVATLWQALGRVEETTGGLIRGGKEGGGLLLSCERPVEGATATCGAVRARVSVGDHVADAEADGDADDGGEGPRLILNLQLAWQDRLRLIACGGRPEVIEAVADRGEPLRPRTPGGPAWQQVAAGDRGRSDTLVLSAPPPEARRLVTLKLRWPVLAAVGFARCDVHEPIAGGSYPHDDVRIDVERIEYGDDGRLEVRLLVVRELAPPQPPEVQQWENRLEIFDAAGRPFEIARKTAFLAGSGVRLQWSFAPPAGDGQTRPHRLRLTYPKLRAGRSLEFQLENLSLDGGERKSEVGSRNSEGGK